ncbi:hypothetical protein FPOA_13434, partial [Fusarium poae]
SPQLQLLVARFNPVTDPGFNTISPSREGNNMRYKNVCYNCIRRKIKCDKHHPSCTHCSGIGLECTYERTVRRNSTSRKAKDRRRGGTKGNIWSESEDDCVMELKRKRLNWEEISKHVPDRSTSACRQRYQYLVRERGEKGAPSSDKWLPEEDTRVRELREKGIKWEDISKRLPGRSATACRLHYQNYLIRRKGRDEEHKNKLAIRYERHKPLRASSSLNTDFGEPNRALAQVQGWSGFPRINMLPGFRELINGVSPYSAPAGAPNFGNCPITTTGSRRPGSRGEYRQPVSRRAATAAPASQPCDFRLPHA